MNGIELCARYAFKPNELGYCGPDNVHKKLLEFCLGESKDENEIVKILERFEGMHPYLRLIAERNDLDPFDKEVVEGYWLGNDLLENVSTKDYRKLIRTDFAIYFSNAKEISKRLPPGAKPCHNAHTLLLFPMVANIPRSDENVQNCLVRISKITPDLHTALISNYQKRRGKVSVHWNWAIQCLSRKQERNLNYYTDYHLDLINYS